MHWRGLRHFQFDWKLTLLVLILLPLLLRLGFWQLAREDEKLQLQNQYAERQQQVAVPIELLDSADDLQYRQVLLQGEYDNTQAFLLDNRIYQGQVGYELISPFYTDEGLAVFINRGWIAQTGSRSDLPELKPVDGRVALNGSVYVPVGEQLVLGDIKPGAQWPKVIQRLDVAELAQEAGFTAATDYFPYSVRLAEGAAGVQVRNWTVISTTPEKHRGYAVQWFSMAGALLLLYLHVSFRSGRKRMELTDSKSDPHSPE